MALIQISDPDKDKPVKKQFSVGIDLGTTNSLIAESVDKEVTFLKKMTQNYYHLSFMHLIINF